MMKILAASKGFGFGGAAPAPKADPKKRSKGAAPKRTKKSIEPAVKQTLDLLERSKGGSAAADITSPTKGRVDYVRVKDWGSGKRPEDIGELQVASPVLQASGDVPFYDQVARQLEILQREGALEVARPKGSPPVPPFNEWAFAEEHYVQYLVDLHCVHSALEGALQAVQQAASSVKLGDSSLGSVLGLLGADSGLQRSSSIAQDLAQLRATSAASEQLPDSPSPNAAAFAKYLTRDLAFQCGNAEDDVELSRLAMRLLAQVYIAMLTLLTSGNRVGATAAEALGLFGREAISTYKNYPKDVPNPVTAFRTAANEAGSALSDDQKEDFLAELPDAMRRSAILLDSVAR